MARRRTWIIFIALIAAIATGAIALTLLRPATGTDLSRSQGQAGGGERVTIPAHTFDPHIIQVSAGADHTLALADDGTVFAWGENSHGQLGDGTTLPKAEPNPVDTADTPMAGAHITQVSAGPRYSVALSEDGRVFSWGNNAWGRLGDGTDHHRPVPVEVMVDGTPMQGAHITQVSAGQEHTLALSSDGELFGWGSDEDYRLAGVPTNLLAMEPVAIPTPVAMTDITASGSLSAAVGEDGGLYTWGRHVGTRDSGVAAFDVDTPTPVDTPEGEALARIVHLGNPIGTALLAETGTLIEGSILGDGKVEQNADGATIVYTGSVFEVADTSDTAVVTRGDGFMLRLTPSGEVLSSEIDNRTAAETGERVLLPELPEVSGIDAGVHHWVALTARGAVFMWGTPSTDDIDEKEQVPRLMDFPGNRTVVQVFFGDAEAEGFSLDRTGGIKAITPAQDPGEVDVRIVFDDGSETVLERAFTYTD